MKVKSDYRGKGEMLYDDCDQAICGWWRQDQIWVGADLSEVVLNRAEARELAARLTHWADNGTLRLPSDGEAPHAQ